MTTDRMPAVNVTIHSMPCTNSCRHCWAHGTTERQAWETDQILFVLDEIAGLREIVSDLVHFFFFEPSNHPEFHRIFGRASSLGLIWERFFFPTNGSGLVELTDREWEDLKSLGLDRLQFSIFGLPDYHDQFVGREGAFDDIVSCMRRCNRHGLKWFVANFICKDNIQETSKVSAYLNELEIQDEIRVGSLLIMEQGRAASPDLPTMEDFAAYPELTAHFERWISLEVATIASIMADPKAAERPVSETFGGVVNLEIDSDMCVYVGGACDGGGPMAALPGIPGGIQSR